MLEKIQRTIDEHHLLKKQSAVLVGISGGADSLALLHVLNELKNQYAIRLHALHVNYGLRGKESDEDEIHAAEWCKRLGVPFYSTRESSFSYIIEQKENVQLRARQIRFEYFEKMASELEAEAVALGHHVDDQAETILMKIVKGTGPGGLAGIPYKRQQGPLAVVRPLLDVSRQEIEMYCAAMGLDFRTDSSNLSKKYFRNQVRLDMIPFLKQYNPNIKNALIHLANTMRNENLYMEEQARKALDRTVVFSEGRAVSSRRELLELPIALQRRVVLLILNYLSLDDADWSHLHLASIQEALVGNRPQLQFHLKNGIWFTLQYDRVIFGLHAEKREDEPYTLQLNVPGQIHIPQWKGTIIASVSEAPLPTGPSTATFDYDGLKSPAHLEVRNRRAGDRMLPKGLNGSKKVKDMFIEKKLPSHLREVWPHIVYDKQIIWVPGIHTSEVAKPNHRTTRFLNLEATNFTLS